LQWNKPHNVKQLEEKLSRTVSRAPSVADFKVYLSTRFKVQKTLYAHYESKVFRIYRWWNWRDRRSSEDRFIDKIGKVFGQDCILAYGTWSSWSGMKGLESTPTVGLRRRIAQKYQVIGTLFLPLFPISSFTNLLEEDVLI
jgi:hypothetical protein